MVRNTSVLLSGNILAQIITLAAYPIISRIYSPDEMGTLNLFVTIFAIFVLLANAEYQNVLVFHKNEKDLPSVLAVCLSCVALVTTLVLLTVPFSAEISSIFGSEAYEMRKRVENENPGFEFAIKSSSRRSLEESLCSRGV